MPNIMQTSELRNYTSVVNEVKYSSRVYLAKNGAGSDNYDRYERI